MKQRMYVLSILLATSIVAPAAYAQVLGGGVNIGGGAGLQTGPVNLGGAANARGEVGVDARAVERTTRAARRAAARAQRVLDFAVRAAASARAAADARTKITGFPG